MELDLFDISYPDVNYIELMRKGHRVKAYVVKSGKNDWAGAYYKDKMKAYGFSDYLRSKDVQN